MLNKLDQLEAHAATVEYALQHTSSPRERRELREELASTNITISAILAYAAFNREET
jgi:hypothetical protein